jgi:outer membrane protein
LLIHKNNAEVVLNTSKMSRLPNLNASGSQNWNFGRTQIQSGLYESQSQSATNVSISSSITIFSGFRINNEIAKNKLELETSIQNLEKAKDDLALNIAALFLQVLFNKELLKIIQEQLTLSESQIEQTRSLTEVGKAPMSQLYDIEAQCANDKVLVVEAENNLRLSLLDLTQSLDLEHNENFDVITPVFNDVITAYIDSVQQPENVFEKAVQINPSIKAHQLQVQSAKKTFSITKSTYYPTLNVSMGIGTHYFYLYKKGFKNTSFSKQIGNNMGEYIGLDLSIPIFNRFSTRNQVRNARLNIENQQLALENAKKTLRKEIETAYLNALAAQEKYKAAQQAIKATSESFNYAKERYESGKSSVFEFNEARTRYMRSQSEEIQAKYDFIFRTKILDFYTGVEMKL